MIFFGAFRTNWEMALSSRSYWPSPPVAPTMRPSGSIKTKWGQPVAPYAFQMVKFASLMIAFTAEYAGGELHPDGREIAEVRWFAPDALPDMPPSLSIARRLIDATAARLRQS